MKGHAWDFPEKGEKKKKGGGERAKYLKIWSKMCKIWKYFEKGQSHACDYGMHETARICLDIPKRLDMLLKVDVLNTIIKRVKSHHWKNTLKKLGQTSNNET